MANLMLLKNGDESYIQTVLIDGVQPVQAAIGVLKDLTAPCHEIELDAEKLHFTLELIDEKLTDIWEALMAITNKKIVWETT